jgi:HlyD family secretion protein
MKTIDRRIVLIALGALATGACQTGEAAEESSSLLTTAVIRGDLLIRAEAVGSVEPVREVEVKSKASGEILRLFIDIGDVVERGTLLAEIDPRDVRNRYDQTEADLAVAEAQLEISQNQLGRQRRLLEAEVITQTEFESATLSFANATAGRVRAQTNFDLAVLQLADVSIRAPMSGTIIQKNVEEGTVIQSASSNVSGGTALFIMADLGDMQVRTLVDETDMGELEPGQVAAVKVEAFPDRTFHGTIDKIEPQAINEQNVTMFPVIVSIDNRSGLLKPGMNAEVEVFIDEAIDILMVANNAIVQTTDAGPAAMALGLDIESMDLSQFMRAGRGGARRGGAQGEGRQGAGDGARGGADGQRAGGAGEGTADAMAQVQALRAQAEAGEITQDAMRAAMQALRGQRGGSFGAAPGEAPPRETRPAVLFVLGPDSIPMPRLVQLGLGDWDNTQVVSGVEEGEMIVIVSAAQMQARQAEFMSRFTGGSPFGGGGGRGR